MWSVEPVHNFWIDWNNDGTPDVVTPNSMPNNETYLYPIAPAWEIAFAEDIFGGTIEQSGYSPIMAQISRIYNN